MEPRDAALALVQENCNLKIKPQLKISMRNERQKPPATGTVELRLDTVSYIIPREALVRLSIGRMNSSLEFSNVELRGPVKRAVIERAIERTKRCPLSAEETRRLYEIIWWLGQVEFAWPEKDTSDEATTERIVVDHPVRGRLSVQPGGPRKQQFALCWTSLSECYSETFDTNLYASFIDFLFRETFQRQGVDFRQITAVLGHESYSSADERFKWTAKPPAPNDAAASEWLDRMLRILKKDRYVIWDLVSFEEPLRYSDSRIDDALFQILRDGLSPAALKGRMGDAKFRDATLAAEALARRRRVEAFPIIIDLLRAGNGDVSYHKNDLLKAAVILARRKPEYRNELTAYLTTQLNDIARSPHNAGVLFDSVWRADLREMTPILKRLAIASTDEIEDDYGSSRISHPQPVSGHFHGARRVLIDWKETDALTKLKLDAIIEASTPFSSGHPEFLRQEFEALPEEERRTFTKFVRWLDEHRLQEDGTSWSTEPLVRAFAGPE